MYPDIRIGGIELYSFWLCLTLAWALFFSLLHYLSLQQNLSKNNIFTDSITLMTLMIFLFWRIFYILGNWVEDKFLIQDLIYQGDILWFLKQFFISDNYNISFAGWIIGFLLVFFWKRWTDKIQLRKQIDILVTAFLLAWSLWYFWALLGWQLYGITSNFPFSITYTSSVVPLTAPTFPLPIIYIIISLCLGMVSYFVKKRWNFPDGIIGYGIGGIYFTLVFILEFYNGSMDIFSSKIWLNLTQLLAFVMISFSIVWILRIAKD